MGGDMSELDPCDTFRAAAVKGDPFESPPENSDDPFNAAPVKTTTSHTRTSLRQWCSKAIPRMTDWTSTVAASCAGDLSDELVALDNGSGFSFNPNLFQPGQLLGFLIARKGGDAQDTFAQSLVIAQHAFFEYTATEY